MCAPPAQCGGSRAPICAPCAPVCPTPTRSRRAATRCCGWARLRWACWRLLAVLLVFLPSAEIRLTPPEQTQSVLISIRAAPEVRAPQISGDVPLQTLTLTLKASGSARRAGLLTVPDQAARGFVRLTNRSRAPVSVPAGALLLTRSEPPVAFFTLEAVELPAGRKSSAEVPIQAVEAGARGNVPAGAVSAFEGRSACWWRPSTRSRSPAVRIRPSLPSEADFDFLRARLLADLEREARARFASQVTGRDVLLPDSLRLERVFEGNRLPRG